MTQDPPTPPFPPTPATPEAPEATGTPPELVLSASAAPSAEERQWAMLAHLLTLLGYLVAFGHFVPPLVILLAKGSQSEYVSSQAKESLNFQITVLLAAIVCLPLICVLIGIPLLMLIGLAHLVLAIVAAIAASDGRRYRYPCALRFVR